MAHDTHTEEDAMTNANVVWTAEEGWHDGHPATISLDGKGRLMTTYSSAHWHCESGLAGYGPDAADRDWTVHTDDTEGIEGLVVSISEECRTWADSERQGAHSLAESGDHKGAWETLMNAEALETLALNFDNKRASAPLYGGDMDEWIRTVRDELIPATFPHPVDEGRSNIYVWQCDNQECVDAADAETFN